MFSKTKKEAEQFCARWEEELGRAQIIGQRAANRAEIIASLSRLRALPFRAAERELWE
ncbi:hypothetical protein FACS189491_12530 [Spirochaetia bacterium]|nr:hypothetical protein FACS189491_12530 [Spirochaetia bacterium]